MHPIDTLLTHTIPVLASLALVPFSPGLEISLVKSYLLFQELYGHAGVVHRGKCFGPFPWLVSGLGIELTSSDHQPHHIRSDVNYCKRFSLYDRAFGTWGAPRDAKRSE